MKKFKPVTMAFTANLEEQEIIQRRMKKAGETNKSAHLKRVYFGGDDDGGQRLAELNLQVSMLQRQLDAMHDLLRTTANSKKDNLELNILAGVFMLLYPSVEPSVQATVDRYVDKDAIEKFLEKGKF